MYLSPSKLSLEIKALKKNKISLFFVSNTYLHFFLIKSRFDLNQSVFDKKKKKFRVDLGSSTIFCLSMKKDFVRLYIYSYIIK